MPTNGDGRNNRLAEQKKQQGRIDATLNGERFHQSGPAVFSDLFINHYFRFFVTTPQYTPVMAKNTFREPERVPKQKKQRRQLRLASWLNEFIGLDRLFGEDNAWPIRHIDRILWVTLLLIVYIGLNHNAERLVRRIQRTRTQVDELRSQYTVLNADFMKSGKQSEIMKRVSTLGLADSQTPPHKLVVKSNEH